jgi:hypothetical protein
MDPTARRHRAAAERGRTRLATEPGGHGRLTSPVDSGEPASPEVLPVRPRQPRVRPGALAQGIASGTARLQKARLQKAQPGRLARGVTGGITWLQRVQPGRVARGLADRTAGRLARGIARLQPGRLARGIADRTARLQPGRLARRIRGWPARSQWIQSGGLGRVIAVGTSRFQVVHLRLPARGKAGGTTRVRAGRLAHGITRGAEGFWRQHPREAVAIILLALAGVAYPVPFWWLDFVIWLVGAAIAASSRLWDLSDKWVGLVGPVAVVIIGTAVALTLGGTRTALAGYVHEVLAESLYMIKFGSLAGAGYLVWRIYQGRRSPRLPPWQRRRR